jgi:hypothetical protein
MAAEDRPMSGEGTNPSAAPEVKTKETRVRSTVEFPYTDLSDAEKIAVGVRDLGATACEWDQLAAHLKMAPKGGGFRLQMLGAKGFGLLTYERGDVKLTDIGIRVVDPHNVRGARFDAFMSVPLYKQAFERLNGTAMPPAAAIERMFESMGVAPKQKDKARQVFMRSAKQAGFFEISADRMSKPTNLSKGVPEDKGSSQGQNDQRESGDRNRGGGGSGSGSGSGSLHPFIQGLLDKLPEPETDWNIASRAKWLQTAANIFDLIYIHDGQDIAIEVKTKKEPPS